MKLSTKDLLKIGLDAMAEIHIQIRAFEKTTLYNHDELEQQFKDKIKEIDQKEIFNVKKN